MSETDGSDHNHIDANVNVDNNYDNDNDNIVDNSNDNIVDDDNDNNTDNVPNQLRKRISSQVQNYKFIFKYFFNLNFLFHSLKMKIVTNFPKVKVKVIKMAKNL